MSPISLSLIHPNADYAIYTGLSRPVKAVVVKEGDGFGNFRFWMP
jgi:hypothetical protein